MKYISIVLASLLALTFASCQRDEVDDFGGSGLSGQIQLRFEVQSNDLIDVDTRATEAVESDLQEVYIFLFKENGDPLLDEPMKITDLNMTVTEEYARTYTGQINCGDKVQPNDKVYLYAMANLGTRLSNGIDGAKTAYLQGRTVFMNRLFTSDKLTLEPLGTSVPFTGRASTDGLVTVDQSGRINTYIRLRRPYAKIDFDFHVGNDMILFEPTSYDLCNLPHACAQHYTGEVLAEDVAAGIEYETIADRQFSLTSPMSFGFYMLENLQKAANTVAAYHDRDKKVTDAVTGLNTSEFLNAPKNSTYVVVHGKFTEYSEPADPDNPAVHRDIKYVGDVSYTIHLGDFSKNDFSNFSVERNHWYTYNVTINGVDQIIVEAKDKTETQSGAEGYIIDATESAMIYDLDSHYETVLLRIPLAALDTATGEIAVRDEKGLTMRVTSPYTDDSGGANPGTSNIVRYEDLFDATLADVRDAADGSKPFTFPKTIKLLKDNKAIDVNWIRYVSQNQGNNSVAYSESLTSVRNSMNTYDLILVLGRLLVHIKEDYDKNGLAAFENWENNTKIYKVGGLPAFGFTGKIDLSGNKEDPNNPNYQIYVVREDNRLVAYFTAFVDEYVYDYNPYTNTTLNDPTKPANWPEYTNTIPRVIDLASNPVTSDDGASTYATILYSISQKSIGTPFRTDDPSINAYGFESVDETRPTSSYTYLNNTNGDDLDGLNNYRTILKEFNNGLTFGTSKWYDFVNFSITSNAYTGPRDDKINNMMVREYASFLCLQRNRDKNGNDKIDEEEIEWYLPAINQYMSMWIGAEGVRTTARLFDNNTSDAAANRSQYNLLSHMYTSSGEMKRIYWAIEGASYGQFGGGTDGNHWMSSTHGVRCARNLQFTGDAPSYSSVLEQVSDEDGNTVTVYNLGNLAPEAVRSTASYFRSEYGPHHERQVQNKPAERFQLARKDLEVPEREVATLPVLAAPKISQSDIELRDHTMAASPEVTATITRSRRYYWENYTYTLNVTIADTRDMTYGWTDISTQPASDDDWTVISNKTWSVSQTTTDTHTYYIWGRDAAGNYTAYTSVQLVSTGFGNSSSRTAPVTTQAGDTHQDLYFKMSSLLNPIDMSKYDGGDTDLHLRCGDNTNITYEIAFGNNQSYQEYKFKQGADGAYYTVSPIRSDVNSPIKIRARYTFSKLSETYPSNPVIINKVGDNWVLDETSGQDTQEGSQTSNPTYIFSSDYVATSNNLCNKYYSELRDGSDLGLWRVPNQRELAVLVLRGLGNTTLTANAYYFSRTTFSNTNVGRTLFYYDNMFHIMQLVTDKTVDAASSVAPLSGRIRCVRDREPKAIDKTVSAHDGRYRNGSKRTN